MKCKKIGTANDDPPIKHGNTFSKILKNQNVNMTIITKDIKTKSYCQTKITQRQNKMQINTGYKLGSKYMMSIRKGLQIRRGEKCKNNSMVFHV